MDLKGLSEICGGLGYAQEDENGVRIGYTKNEFCLDNLKDLQRFLRRDDPQTRDVFRQVCKWNTVSVDLIPIIERYQNDRNLVINAVKILVFLTMPIDPASDNIPQQIEDLWSLKAAITRNDTIAVIVALLEDPLENLERDAFTEDDWKLVQLVLTLFRNILAIQDLSLQQKASGSATQFLCLRDRFLELMFHENVMDLILVLTQHVTGSCGYLRQDNMLLLETFHYIFFGQDPELIAKSSQKGSKVDGDINTTLNSLRTIMEEEEERRRLIRLRNLNRHSQFSGMFTRFSVDGSKTLFKGNPATISGDSLLRAHKVQRGPLKRIAWDHGNLSLPKGNILELLHDFVNQFLSGGFNVLMQSIRVDIEKEHHGIQNSDVIVFFQLAHFATAFQNHKFSISKPNTEKFTSEASSVSKNADNSLFNGDICGPIAAIMNEAMFLLLISKWRDAFDGLKETKDYKFLSAAGSLMKGMIQMLDLVLKLLPEDSKEPQTARILLYKIFYDQTDQGMTQFLVNLIRAFDTHKQPKSDLADLIEIIYVVLRLMEKLQARGSLRVSRKARKGRKKKQLGEKNEAEAEKIVEVNGCIQNADDPNLEIGNTTGERGVNLSEFVEEDLKNSSSKGKEESTSVPDQIEENEIPLQDFCNLGGDSVFLDKNKSSNGLNDMADDSSDDDQPASMNEVDFDVSKLVATFANNTVIQNLCWLLKFYKSNSASTNHYIVGIMQRICDDLELSPMLYQLSLLTTFYDILSEQKSSSCKEYENIISFLTKIVRKLLKKMKSQPLLFVEILFWKTRKECHYINSESLLHELGNLKKQTRGWGSIPGDDGEIGPSMGKEMLTRRSIADALGEDEADFVIPRELNNQMEDNPSDDNIRLTGEKICDSVGHLKHSRKRIRAFSKEQELMVKELFEQFKNHKRCSYMIANALDADNMYTAAQISRKLKQLGLHIPQKKRLLEASNQSGQDNDDKDTVASESKEQSSDGETLMVLKKRRKGKGDSKLISEEATMTNTSKQKIKTQLPQDESDDETLSNVVQRKGKGDSKLISEEATMTSTSKQKIKTQLPQDESDDETLSNVLQRKGKGDIKLISEEATITSTSKQKVKTQLTQDESDDETLSHVLQKTRRHIPKKKKDKANLVQETAIADGSETIAPKNVIQSDGLAQNYEMELDPSLVGVGVAVHLPDLNDNLKDELANVADAGGVTPVEGMDISSKLDYSPHRRVNDELEDSGDDVGPVMPKSIGLRRKLKMVIDLEDDE